MKKRLQSWEEIELKADDIFTVKYIDIYNTNIGEKPENYIARTRHLKRKVGNNIWQTFERIYQYGHLGQPGQKTYDVNEEDLLLFYREDWRMSNAYVCEYQSISGDQYSIVLGM